jgi:hypothetical protein
MGGDHDDADADDDRAGPVWEFEKEDGEWEAYDKLTTRLLEGTVPPHLPATSLSFFLTASSRAPVAPHLLNPAWRLQVR